MPRNTDFGHLLRLKLIWTEKKSACVKLLLYRLFRTMTGKFVHLQGGIRWQELGAENNWKKFVKIGIMILVFTLQ